MVMTGCNLWPLYNTTNWKNICVIFVMNLRWPCKLTTIHSMNNTFTFTIKDDNYAEARLAIREFCLLTDNFWALEVASCATEFAHGNTEWAKLVITEQKTKVLYHLLDMVDVYGYAEGMDGLNAKRFRGIVSDADYMVIIASYLRRLITD